MPEMVNFGLLDLLRSLGPGQPRKWALRMDAKDAAQLGRVAADFGQHGFAKERDEVRSEPPVVSC